MHPVHLHVTYVERQSRLTTFFRYFLLIPHAIVSALWAIPVYFITIGAWFAILVTGSYPKGMWEFSARWLRYTARVNCFGVLLADGFPPFEGDSPYPVMATIDRQERLSRLTTFFRTLVAIPAWVILYVMAVCGNVVAFVLWWVIMITGRSPKGMHGFLVTVQRYNVRTSAYLLLLTDRYPSFELAPDQVEGAQLTSSG